MTKESSVIYLDLELFLETCADAVSEENPFFIESNQNMHNKLWRVALCVQKDGAIHRALFFTTTQEKAKQMEKDMRKRFKRSHHVA